MQNNQPVGCHDWKVRSGYYRGKCASSYGELLQGVLPNNEHFLVTIPINLSSYATFSPDWPFGIRVFPTSKKKVELFLNKLDQVFDLNLSGSVLIESQIPEGKGLSSSTADLIAALRSIENYLNLSFPKEIIGEILSEVEPSDGLLYEGSVAYNHRKCTLIKPMGFLPKLAIISIDDGGMVDTMSYNGKEKLFTENDQMIYALLLNQMTQAFENLDLKKIGEIATTSALLNQKFNFKQDLEKTILIANSIGAYGVINTHSGTCLGLLLDPMDCLVQDARADLQKTFSHKSIAVYYTI